MLQGYLQSQPCGDWGKRGNHFLHIFHFAETHLLKILQMEGECGNMSCSTQYLQFSMGVFLSKYPVKYAATLCTSNDAGGAKTRQDHCLGFFSISVATVIMYFATATFVMPRRILSSLILQLLSVLCTTTYQQQYA